MTTDSTTAEDGLAKLGIHLPIPTPFGRAVSELIHYHELDRGGHFAAWEQPGLFVAELGGVQIASLNRDFSPVLNRAFRHPIQSDCYNKWRFWKGDGHERSNSWPEICGARAVCCAWERVAFLLVAVAAVAGVVAVMAPPFGRAEEGAAPQAARDAAPPRSAREVRGPTPYAAIENEPPPKLIVDPALPDLLDKGVVWIQYRTENVPHRPGVREGTLDVSPRVGHLHVHVDDLPWLWADASDLNTVDIAGMPPGEHKVTIELVDANHQVFPGQAKTVKFTVPKTASPSH